MDFSFIRKQPHALRIIVIYALVGFLWVYTSDTVMGWFVPDPRLMVKLGIFKGTFFIILTSLILYVLINRYSKHLTDSEQALKSNDIYLRTILETVPECVKLVDSNYNLLMMNRAGLEIIEADSPEQVKGLCLIPLVAPPYREAFAELTKHIFLGNLDSLEFEIIGLKGRRAWLETQAAPFKNEDGKIIALLGITRDITEKKRADTILHARLKMNDIASAANLDDLLQSAVDEAEALTGSSVGFFHFLEEDQINLKLRAWSTSTLTNRCSTAGKGPHHPVESAGVWADCVRERKPVIHNDYAALTHKKGLPEGHVPILRELVLPIIREDRIDAIIGVGNKPTDYTEQDVELLQQFASIACDIALRKRAETALKESEERYRTLVNNIPLGIALIGGDHRIVMVNQTQATWFGHPPAWFVGRRCYEVLEKREHTCAYCPGTASNEHGKEGFVDTEGIRNDGSCFWVRIRTVQVNNAAGEVAGFLEVAEDITERKQLEADRRNMEEQMLHAQKLESLGILAGGIAHDFNNIILAILGNAELAKMRLSPTSPAQENIARIEQASQRAAELARQMLAYSGKGKFVVEPIDLKEIIEEMSHMLDVSISKKAELRYNFATDLPPIEADATQIRQIVMNLVINASEAIGEENGIIAISTGAIRCESNHFSETWLNEKLPAGLYVYFEVTDTGCGMDRDTIAKMFDPFFTTKFTGRGLGMAAVLGIVRGHHGAIKVDSEPGKGSTFKILLPAAAGVALRANNEITAQSLLKGTGTILLVDDEEAVRVLGAEMLAMIGFKVLTAENGRQAIDIYRSRQDEIIGVLLDLTMPFMDGEETLGGLLRINREVRVIIASGFSEQEVTHRFMGKGTAGFIQKPFTFRDLSSIVRKVFTVQGPPDEARS